MPTSKQPPKPWTGSIHLLLPEIEKAYRAAGSPMISDDVDSDLEKLIRNVKDRRNITKIIIGAIAEGRAPDAENVLGASFETIFFTGVMRSVASRVQRQIDKTTGLRKYIAGRDVNGSEIWALTASELGVGFYKSAAQQALGTIIDAAVVANILGDGGTALIEELFDEVYRGYYARLDSLKADEKAA